MVSNKFFIFQTHINKKMHYYQFSIGDYKADTAHLSIIEHGIYRLLIDLYYLNEKPLPSVSQLKKILMIKSPEELFALKKILKEFFEKEKNTFIHKRCSDEINCYKMKSLKNSLAISNRWQNYFSKKSNKNKGANESNVIPYNNHKPLTINHSSYTNEEETIPSDAKQYFLKFIEKAKSMGVHVEMGDTHGQIVEKIEKVYGKI